MKRGFDIVVSLFGLVLTSWLIILAWFAATVDTRQNGFFTQVRAGKDGHPFRIIKIRTMRRIPGMDSTVTVADDPRITQLGRLLRRTKIDELPQLLNVLAGHMSFVGPRPDVPEYAAALAGEDRVILSVRPGITGPATLKYRDEEAILAGQADPQRYNDEVIYPDKVRLNREYVETQSFVTDLEYIWRTLFG
jgi:lipopolysaccharide/colanic/teichoic acid biosynthesis glycosyltransferase